MHPTIISRHFWPALESSDIIMPGQFEKYVQQYIHSRQIRSSLLLRLQTQYAREYSTFKPDKKLRWLPHLGTVHLELQLEDRKLTADVAPLEAAFIELFSEKSNLFYYYLFQLTTDVLSGVWTLDSLITRVGLVDRSSALKALVTWVDLGVLKEDGEHSFRLLEVAEEVKPSAKSAALRPRQLPTTFNLKYH